MRNHAAARDAGLKRLAWILLWRCRSSHSSCWRSRRRRRPRPCARTTRRTCFRPARTQCRPVCETPAKSRSPLRPRGLGSGVFSATARNPYTTGVLRLQGRPRVRRPRGRDALEREDALRPDVGAALHPLAHVSRRAARRFPIPATALVTVAPDAGSYLAGWSSNCAPSQKVADSRTGVLDPHGRAEDGDGDAHEHGGHRRSGQAHADGPEARGRHRSSSRGAARPTRRGWPDSRSTATARCTRRIRARPGRRRRSRSATSSARRSTLGDPRVRRDERDGERPGADQHGHAVPEAAAARHRSCTSGRRRCTRQKTAFFHWGVTWKSGQQKGKVTYQCKLDKQKYVEAVLPRQDVQEAEAGCAHVPGPRGKHAAAGTRRRRPGAGPSRSKSGLTE